jgi:hypothetical protein
VGVKVAVLVPYDTLPAMLLFCASLRVMVVVVMVLEFMSLSKTTLTVVVVATSVALEAGLVELTCGGAEELPVGELFACAAVE